jgi:hypothetical protein
VTRKCKIINVVYNAINNELVRTQTLVKGAIVSVDSLPFKYYWHIHYEEKKINKLPDIPDPEKKKRLEEKKEKLKKKHPYAEQIEKLHHIFDIKVDCLLALLQDRVSLVDAMVICWRVENLISTLKRWKRNKY